MYKNYEARHIFMAIAIGILVISPFLLLPLPTFIATNMHGTEGWVVFVPGKAYLLYALGFLFLFVSSLVLFILNLSKVAKISSVIAVLISVAFFMSAVQKYTVLADDSITFRESIWTDRHTYAWNEVDNVKFNLAAKGFPVYEFQFKDGAEMTLPENGHIRIMRTVIERKLKEYDVEISKKYY
ncbi:hypothetical protein SLU01_27470 [Sporosarcina luteola]|uniref:DUF5673 domain-containing protein n=1 Tax=Sporosarcina luteola TaxID=582850 RepID=A0A511ZAE6_9BACL|nr:hypothetical protein [Sporosarcina luteola]GEN84435.1 hypothetical protein SLU01_27470 [Sporosarcina luteola]